MADNGRISVGAKPFKPIEVELWGTLYHTKPVTRSLGTQTDELASQLNAAVTADDVVGVLGKMVDLYLTPAGGGKKKPSSILKEKWDKDEATLPEINGLVDDLTEAAQARPT